MVLLIPPRSLTTYVIYANSVFQAVSLYAVALWFGELFSCRRSSASGVTATKDREQTPHFPSV